MHRYIQRIAAVVALFAFIATATAALAQESAEPPPPPPPPPDQQQTPRQTDQRQDARRNAAAGQVVRQQKRGISPVRYTLGGLVGTFYGLGLGHAINGEWSNKGWIFTVGEIAAGAVMIYGMSETLAFDGSQTSTRRGEMLMVAGSAGMVLFRIFEIHDVWTRPEVASVPKSTDTAFAVGPVGADGGFGALFQMRW